MHVPKGLVMAPHDPKRHHRPTVLGDHAGNDSMQWAFARPNTVGVPGFNYKTLGSISEHHAGLWCHQTGTEIVEKSIDKTARITVFIDHTDVNSTRVIGERGLW